MTPIPNPDTALAQALDWVNRGQIDAAQALCRQALARAPEHPGVHQLLGVIELQRAHATGAVQADAASAHTRTAYAHLTRSLAARPDHLPTLTMALGAARTLGLVAEAAVLATRAANLQPGNLDLTRQQAALLTDAGAASTALPILRRLVAADPAFAAAWYELGRAAHRSGLTDDACAAFEQAVALRPELVPGWFALALVRQDLHQFAPARQALDRVLALDAQHVEAAVNLGIVLQELGDLDAALASYGRAFRLRAETFGRIAHALASAGKGAVWLDLEALRTRLAKAGGDAGT